MEFDIKSLLLLGAQKYLFEYRSTQGRTQVFPFSEGLHLIQHVGLATLLTRSPARAPTPSSLESFHLNQILACLQFGISNQCYLLPGTNPNDSIIIIFLFFPYNTCTLSKVISHLFTCLLCAFLSLECKHHQIRDLICPTQASRSPAMEH